jgi:glycosyltransferase involved in cell wall biosynthesis/SAM-dependent methyltransferase
MPKALIVVTEDWYFCSHRLPMARALREAGYEVSVATRLDRHEGQIRAEGFEIHPLPSLQRGLAAWRELGSVLALAGLYRRLRPDLLVHVALKPVFLGGLASLLAGRRPTVNILTGMGFVFTSRSMKAALFRLPISALLRFLLEAKGIKTVVQNQEDLESLTAAGILPQGRTELVRGSGVDVRHFSPLPEPEEPFTAAAVCRILGDKGVYDLVEAVRILRSRGSAVNILLVGPIDPLNPTAVMESELVGWQRAGLLEWLGPASDVRAIWARSHAAVLPSHREGLPKALVEAAACGRPIVTTDTTGCREVVEDGVNGILVPLRDPTALADALSRLALDRALRRARGAASRRRAEALFSEEVVIGRLVAICREAYMEVTEPSLADGANLDPETVRGFGDEWSRFDQTGVSDEELDFFFDRYFSIFPWETLPKDAVGFDMGCGSGRWAKRVAPRVGRLICVDASPAVLEVAKRALRERPNCRVSLASVDALPIPDRSMDFGYSLGVLHHVPDTKAGLAACVGKLKPGAPFLLYLYYSLDNRSAWYRSLWRLSDFFRSVSSRTPYPLRAGIAFLLALFVYWPCARISALIDWMGGNSASFPLSYYRRSSFYTMATDALDRFGTRLERRFSRAEIEAMMSFSGLEDIRFREEMPYWVAVGFRRKEA